MNGFKVVMRFENKHWQMLFLDGDTVKHAAAYPEGNTLARNARAYDEFRWLKHGEYIADDYTVALQQ